MSERASNPSREVRAYICPEVDCDATVVALWAGPQQHYSCHRRGHRLPVPVVMTIDRLLPQSDPADGADENGGRVSVDA